MITLNDIAFGYSTPILHVQQLELNKGTLYALAGSNGTGKSTLLKTLNGEIGELKGNIKVLDRSLSALDRRSLSRLIAFVSSSFQGVEFLTVEEYVALGRSPYTNWLGKRSEEDLRIAHQSLQFVGIDHMAQRETLELSDGERQLAAIARAIAQDTPIILLDEPTAFLDYANRKKVISLLNQIAIGQKKCIVFSSHDIDLCLEEKLPLLIIEKKTRELHAYPQGLDKESLLKIGFSE